MMMVMSASILTAAAAIIGRTSTGFLVSLRSAACRTSGLALITVVSIIITVIVTP